MKRKNFLLTKDQCVFLTQYENESEIIRRALDAFIATATPKVSPSLSGQKKDIPNCRVGEDGMPDHSKCVHLDRSLTGEVIK